MSTTYWIGTSTFAYLVLVTTGKWPDFFCGVDL